MVVLEVFVLQGNDHRHGVSEIEDQFPEQVEHWVDWQDLCALLDGSCVVVGLQFDEVSVDAHELAVHPLFGQFLPLDE